MKQRSILVPALALMAPPALAQSMALDHVTGTGLEVVSRSVLEQPGHDGSGAGAWVGPTHTSQGSAQAVCYASSGERSYELDVSLTRYVFLGAGLELGGLSGALLQDGEVRYLVEGEWVRTTGRVGHFNALVFELDGRLFPSEVAGALQGRIAYDAWDEPLPGDPVVDLGGSQELVPRSTGPALPIRSPAQVQGIRAGSDAIRGAAVRRAPNASPVRRDAARLGARQVLPVPVDRPAPRPETGLTLQRAGFSAEDLRDAERPAGRTEATAAVGEARAERAPAHTDLGDVMEPDAPNGTDVVIDATRLGVFELTYNLLR